MEPAGPFAGVGTGIVDRDLVVDGLGVEAREALDRVHLGRVRQAAAVEPEALVEADAVDEEGVALPLARRVAVVARAQFLRMRAAVHVDDAEGVRPADVEDVEALDLGQLDELDAVGREELPRGARRLAARVRLELVHLPRVVERARPRLERHGVERGNRRCDAELRRPHALVRRRGAAEQHAATLVARRRAGWRLVRVARPALREREVAGQQRERGDRDGGGDSCEPRGRERQARSHCGAGVSLPPAAASIFTDDAASSVAPGRPPVEASVTVRAFMRLSPLRARKPSILTCSPTLSVVRCQPLRWRPCGGPSSAPQFATWPVAGSLTFTYSQTCGFAQSTFVTIPSIDIFLSASNSAENE